MVLQVPEALWTAALMMSLLVLFSPMVQVKAIPEDFLFQGLKECYERNGTHRYVERYFYNREEFVRFDSDVGEFRAVTELGRPDAKYWNGQTDLLEEKRAVVETVCRHNYEITEGFALKRRVQPKVNVSPSKKGPLQHHNTLVCHVTDFYPGNIQVRWFLNGKEETAGVVSTNVIRNGDWTYQILVMLEMIPQQGDVYTCHVEHPSLDRPVTVEWTIEYMPEKEIKHPPVGRGHAVILFPPLLHPFCVWPHKHMQPACFPSHQDQDLNCKAQSDSARTKMLTGVGGFVLGLTSLVASFVLHLRNQRGRRQQ